MCTWCIMHVVYAYNIAQEELNVINSAYLLNEQNYQQCSYYKLCSYLYLLNKYVQ